MIKFVSGQPYPGDSLIVHGFYRSQRAMMTTVPTAQYPAMTADSASPPDDPVSPCIGVCVMNPQTQLCEGCFRTLDEIAGWWEYPPRQKQDVLAQLEERLTRIMGGVFFD